MTAPGWSSSLLAPAAQTLTVTGGTVLCGEVEVFGSKKSLPKIMVASLLTDEPCHLDDVSWIEDVAVASSMLGAAGRSVTRTDSRSLSIEGRCSMPVAPIQALGAVAGMSRVPILTAGPQLARFGQAWIPPLGGDRIGMRGITVHISLLRRLGARVEVRDGWIHATAAGLCGAALELPFPMVGVTEHALLSAVLAEGRTELRNAAVDPEIEELGAVLRTMGARVEIDRTRRVVAIDGVETLAGFRHVLGRDRIEAGSWASLALAVAGDITVRGVTASDMSAFLPSYRAAGGEATGSGSAIRFTGTTAPGSQLRIESGPYPLYETDWHPPMMAALTQVGGESSIHETLFESRFTSVPALRAMGADIDLLATCGWDRCSCRLGTEGASHRAVVRGPTRLTGGRARVPDLRGGFALLVAALASPGDSILAGAELLRRGYEDLPTRLKALGGLVDVAE
jgi:UDP-N-acetylglucosamine 1-carboxyvinyltransferase